MYVTLENVLFCCAVVSLSVLLRESRSTLFIMSRCHVLYDWFTSWHTCMPRLNYVLFCCCVTTCSVAWITLYPIHCVTLCFAYVQKCFYCRSSSAANSKDNGACVQCCAGKCAVSFHVTCFVLAGFVLEPSDWPQPTETYCEMHQRTRFKVRFSVVQKSVVKMTRAHLRIILIYL